MNCKNCGAPVNKNGYCSYCKSYYGEINKTEDVIYPKGNEELGKWISEIESISPTEFIQNTKSWGVLAAASALTGIISLG
jgi:hypothetical protein